MDETEQHAANLHVMPHETQLSVGMCVCVCAIVVVVVVVSV